MRIEARSEGSTVVGGDHAGYDSNPAQGEGERRPFRTDGNGAPEWLHFVEPVEEDYTGIYPRNWSPEMETTATSDGNT